MCAKSNDLSTAPTFGIGKIAISVRCITEMRNPNENAHDNFVHDDGANDCFGLKQTST